MNDVKIFCDNNWSDELNNFSPFEVIVTSPSRVINAPVQSGIRVPDMQVFDPINIKVIGKVDVGDDIVDGSFVLLRIDDIQQRVGGGFASVQTKDGFYNNLVLQNVINKADSKEYDISHYELEFCQVIMIQGDGKTPLSDDDSSFTRRGYSAKTGV